MTLSEGTKLGPYEVVAFIGSGGMGDVYKARDSRLGRDVAIKLLPSDVAHDVDRRHRFEREARAIAALNHQHICTIHDIGVLDSQSFLVHPDFAWLRADPLFQDLIRRVGIPTTSVIKPPAA